MFKVGDKVMFKSLKKIKQYSQGAYGSIDHFHGIGYNFPLIHRKLKNKQLTIEAICGGDFLIKEDKFISKGNKTGFYYPQNYFKSYLKLKIDKLLKL